MDLGRYLRGEHGEEVPTLLARTDGGCLLYPGKVHAFNAESEAGKTWLALLAVTQQLTSGERCMFLDFEDGPAGIASRLLTLGLREADVAAGLVYVRPDEPLGDDISDAFFATVTAYAPTLVVIDGVTEVMALHDRSIISNDDVAAFMARLVRPLAASGAAVVMLDHLPKSSRADGRYAIGGQHKRAGLGGAVYRLVPETPIGRGLHGRTRIEVSKDRPGYVREMSSGATVGALSVDATGDMTRVWIDVPKGAAGPAQPDVDMTLARAIYDLVAGHRSPVSKRDVRKEIIGKNERKDRTIDWLIAHENLALRIKGQKHLLTVDKPLPTTEPPPR